MRKFVILSFCLLTLGGYCHSVRAEQSAEGMHTGVFFSRRPSESGNCIVRPIDDEETVEMRCTPEQQAEMKLAVIIKYTVDADGAMRLAELVRSDLSTDGGFADFSPENGCVFKLLNVDHPYNMICELTGIPEKSGLYKISFVYYFAGEIFLYKYDYLEPKGFYTAKLAYLNDQDETPEGFCAFENNGAELYRCDLEAKRIFARYPFAIRFDYADYGDFKKVTGIYEPRSIWARGYFVSSLGGNRCQLDVLADDGSGKPLTMACSDSYIKGLTAAGRDLIEFEYVDNDGELILRSFEY